MNRADSGAEAGEAAVHTRILGPGTRPVSAAQPGGAGSDEGGGKSAPTLAGDPGGAVPSAAPQPPAMRAGAPVSERGETLARGEDAAIAARPVRFEHLNRFLAESGRALLRGPIAVVLIEDDVEVASTLAHALQAGFRRILALSPEPLPPSALPDDPKGHITCLRFDARRGHAHVDAVNAVIDAAPPDLWISYFYNAEYLFYPFAETRTVGEMCSFHAEERRAAMLTYVIDLYAGDLGQFPNAVCREQAYFDRTGYYSLGRADRQGNYKERQLDFFGGLRWRFEELLPPDRRRIDRIALFRNRRGLRLLPDHRLNDEEANTYSCPWHHNLTAALMSFRVAKALRRNPGSRDEITGFRWHGSELFRWNSAQLMELGLMEPGQWF